jgi:peptide/nickel transport system substrate-binding protein
MAASFTAPAFMEDHRMLRRVLVTALALIGLSGVTWPALAATPDDTLVIAQNRAANNLHPGVNAALPNIWANMLIYDSLVIGDAQGKVHPALAKRWDISKDGLTWTFSLRDDVKFHSGRKFTANDVKAHFDLWKTLPTGTKITMLDRTEVVNDTTVRFILKNPTLVFLNMISQTEWSYSGIPDSEAVKKYGQDYGVLPESISGTGPYKVTGWVRGDRIELARNPEYKWGPAFYKSPGPARVEKVVIRTIAEDAARTAALERNEIDVDVTLSEKEAPRLAKTKGFRVMVQPKNTAHHIFFNHEKPIFKDQRVRLALMHAIDQKAIVDAVYNGYAQPAVGLWSESVDGHTPKAEMAKIAPAYNPARAKQLLDEAGWKPGGDGIRVKDGQRLAFTAYGYSEQQANLLAVVQEEWREIGAEATVRQLEYAAWQKAVTSGEEDTSYVDGTHHTADFAYWFICKSIPYPNTMHRCDEQTDKYFEITQTTLDPKKRTQAFQDMEKDFMRRAVLIPMPHTMWVVGASEKVADLQLNPIHGVYKLLDVRKTK